MSSTQLGERNLEIPVTTDIFGNANANATRLDDEAASAAIKQAQLHRKVATAIFFESNGGVSHNKAQASLPEIRLAVGQPDLDIGNVETVLEALAPPDGICYYLDTAQNRYWFSMRPNLTRLLASRKEQIKHDDLRETIRAEIIKEVGRFNGNSAIFFPERTNDIPNQPVLTLVVLPPEQGLQQRAETEAIIEQYTLNYGVVGTRVQERLDLGRGGQRRGLARRRAQDAGLAGDPRQRGRAATERGAAQPASRQSAPRQGRTEGDGLAHVQQGLCAGQRGASCAPSTWAATIPIRPTISST